MADVAEAPARVLLSECTWQDDGAGLGTHHHGLTCGLWPPHPVLQVVSLPPNLRVGDEDSLKSCPELCILD